MKESQFKSEIWKSKEVFTEPELLEIFGICRVQLRELIGILKFPVVSCYTGNLYYKKQIIRWFDRITIKKEVEPPALPIKELFRKLEYLKQDIKKAIPDDD